MGDRLISDIRIETIQDAEEILKSIEENSPEFFEKAHAVGDVLDIEGKTYVWTEYKPGQFDWRLQQSQKGKIKIIHGKGIDGRHGISMLNHVYTQIDKTFTDPYKMNLKRTPNGNWRLFYDGNDTGMTIDGNSITMQELRADDICYQYKRVTNNFELVKNYMEFNSPDDVYFVQVIKRWKDNKDKPGADAWKASGKAKGTYHSGAEYMEYYLIHNEQELEAVKADIIKSCSYSNARAYISINSRSESQTNAFLQKIRARYAATPNDPRYKFAEPIAYGMAKTGSSWQNTRLRVLLDIDTTRDSVVTIRGKKVNVWDETRRRLKDLGIKVVAEYETPSGGLHLILNNKNNRNLKPFYRGLVDFDGGRNLDRNATVHPSEDIKMVLYSNVDTEGY